MNVLLINQAFFPDQSATAQYAYDLARGLRQRGMRPTVLTSNRGYLEPNKRYQTREVIDGIEVVRVASPAFLRSIPVLRMLDAFLMNLVFLYSLWRMNNFSAVVCMTSPPALGAILGLLYPSRQGKLVHWAMDINPDQVIRAGWIAADGWLARILRHLQNKFYTRCDDIVVLDHYMKELLRRKHITDTKLHVLPLWWSEAMCAFSQEAVDAFRAKHALSEKTVIMYAGNHSLCHPLDAMLQAAFLLREDRRFHFVFIGGGSRVVEVSDFKKKHSLDNILQLPYQERKDLSAILAAADVQVVSFGQSFVGVVHPSKVYPFLALGLPFILLGDTNNSVRDLLEAGAFGWTLAEHDSGSFVDVVTSLPDMNSVEYEEASKESKRIAEQFKEAMIIDRFYELLAPPPS